MVTADDVFEPVKVSDDVSAAEMSELGSCNADNPSSVIDSDHMSVISSVETHVQPPSDDNVIVSLSTASVNEMVECTATEPVVGTQSNLISSSPSKLVINTSVEASDQCECDVQNALEAESLETFDIDIVAVCETVDETGCDPVVSESLPVSSDVPVTFPSPASEVGMVSANDAEPGGLQLAAESNETRDSAD